MILVGEKCIISIGFSRQNLDISGDIVLK